MHIRAADRARRRPALRTDPFRWELEAPAFHTTHDTADNQGDKVSATEHTASTPKTGLFARLTALLGSKGSGAPSGDRSASYFSVLAMLVTVCATLVAASPASAILVHHYESQLTEAGGAPFGTLAGLAVDGSGDLYVSDGGNHAIDKFDSSGAPVLAWGTNGQLTEAGLTPFSDPVGLAVDGSGDLWAADPGRTVVDEFEPSGGFLLQSNGESHFSGYAQSVAFSNASKHLYVADSNEDDLWVLNSDGSFNSDIKGPWGSGCCLIGVAADNSDTATGGDLYVVSFNGYGSAVYRIDGTGAAAPFSETAPYIEGAELTGTPEGPFGAGPLKGPFGENYPQYLGVDSAGDLFVADDSYGRIDEFDSSGKYIGKLTGTPTGAGGALVPFGKISAIGIGAATGKLYVTDTTSDVVDIFGPGVTVPEVTTEPASAVTTTSATLNGEVNPSGLSVTECAFEYGETTGYGETAPCVEPDAAEIGKGTSAVPVHADVTGLRPDASYHFDIRTASANGSSTSNDRTFATPGAHVATPSSSSVTSTSATVEAEIDPRGYATTYHFEYLTEAEFRADNEGFSGAMTVPVPDASLGSGTEDILAQQHIQNLQPHTSYRYRAAATSASLTTYGPSGAFTTQADSGELQLPDGRHWEMVSPPSKQGALIYALGSGFFESLNVQGSANGNAIAFMTDAPTEANPAGDSQGTMTLATRGKSEWSSQVITPPHARATGISLGNGAEYLFFSEDLSLGLNTVFGAHFNQLSPEATEQTPYIRTLYEHGDVEAHCSSSCYRPLVTATNTPPGTEFGNTANGGCAPSCGPQFAGATPDLSHVLLYSGAKLTTTSVRHSREGLYEWGDGKLQLVSVLPQDESGEGVYGILGGGESGSARHDWRHAVSDDGSRVIWEHEEHLYLRDTTVGQEETIRLDLPQGGPGESSEAHLMIGSSDLSRIFFLDSGQLTANATATGANLYEYNLNAPQGSRLTDLTPARIAGESRGIDGVLGASEDGSYIYYAEGGEIFEYHDGGTTPVAVPGDTEDWGIDTGAPELEQLTARVSPNGAWLAFQSSQDLTGYDTRDAVSGVPDLEVYLYNGETHKLVCASCNPTGARPVGRFTGNGITASLLQANRAFDNTWIAAEIPPWSRFNSEESRYQSRYLSNGGRLFFDSNDALVPQDVNGTVDVYEYEPPGEGSCSAANATFSARSEGCVGLISSGTSAQESSFLDASETGGDVFFMTTASLLPQDVDSAYDIYDAHECTSEVSCYPAAPVLPPACDTGESCKAAESPQPAIFGSPSSETFSGAGNITPSSTMVVTKKATKKKTAGCAKGKKLSHGKCVKAKAKGKKARARKSSNDRRVIR